VGNAWGSLGPDHGAGRTGPALTFGYGGGGGMQSRGTYKPSRVSGVGVSRLRAEIPPDAGGIRSLGGPVGCAGEAGVNCAFPRSSFIERLFAATDGHGRPWSAAPCVTIRVAPLIMEL